MKKTGLARVDVWATCIGIIAPCHALAANWFLDSNAALRSEYNDNLRLTTEQAEAVWGRHFDIDFLVSGATPTSDFRLQPKYHLSRYSSAKQPENDVAGMDVSTRLLDARTVSALSLDWRRDTTLTSELLDTGLIQTTKHRTVRGAHPSIQYEFSERMEGQLRWDYTDVAYEDARLTQLTDYRHHSLAGSWIFKRSALDSIQTELYTSRLDAPEIGNQVTDMGVRASLTHAFYERSYGTFTIGAHRVATSQEIPGPDFHSLERGFLGNVTLTQERSRTSWKAQLQRTVDPSGYGLLVQNDRFTFDITERLNPYWAFRLESVYLQNDALQSPVAFDSRRYVRLASRVLWSPFRAWQFSLRYAHQRQKFASANSYADSNEISAAAAYQFDAKTLYP